MYSGTRDTPLEPQVEDHVETQVTNPKKQDFYSRPDVIETNTAETPVQNPETIRLATHEAESSGSLGMQTNALGVSAPYLKSPIPMSERQEAYERRESDATWWLKTARTIRDGDEAKIKDYKEDIDTLLVFGGLFSAVTTTFLIESYKTLNQDSTEASLQVLLHISQQLNSFALNGGFANSTIAALSSLPTFESSLAPLATNVLWFGSLIISLMAASYGMLVKQWLREFLAGDYTSPQARLRVRCFRYPALTNWKVFEIVGILPLLLQLALGLFFVGLCFFTSSVHPILHRTTVSFVVVWASFLLMATLAPAFSPRCPYKTTFLKDAMKSIRRLMFMLRFPLQLLASIHETVTRYLTHINYQHSTFVPLSVTEAFVLRDECPTSDGWVLVEGDMLVMKDLEEGEDTSKGSMSSQFESPDITKHSHLMLMLRSPRRLLASIGDIIKSYFSHLNQPSPRHPPIGLFSAFSKRVGYIPTEEEDIARNETGDLHVLADVDAIQLDDHLLRTALLDLTSGHRSFNGQDVTSLVLRILHHRDPTIQKSKEGQYPNLRRLSNSLRSAVLPILAAPLVNEVQPLVLRGDTKPVAEWEDWMRDSMCMIFTLAAAPSFDDPKGALHLCLQLDFPGVICMVASRISPDIDNARFERLIGRLWKTLYDFDEDRRVSAIAMIGSYPPIAGANETMFILRIQIRLLEKCAEHVGRTIIETFLQTSPDLLGNSGNYLHRVIAAHIQQNRDQPSNSSCIDELRPLVDTESMHINSIAAIVINLSSSISSDVIHQILRQCLRANLTQFYELCVQCSVSCPEFNLEVVLQFFSAELKALPGETLRKHLHTFETSPYPLPSVHAEFMHLWLAEKTVASLDPHMTVLDAFRQSSGDSSPPAFAVISLALRVIQYRLHRDDIPTSNLQTTLDLGDLDEHTYDDITYHAAKLLESWLWHIDTILDGGLRSLQQSTEVKDAIILLLARSPYRLGWEFAYIILADPLFKELVEHVEGLREDVRVELKQIWEDRLLEGKREGVIS
ncbi:unnamed protein product [Somion occarium]|uniref:DUF6535 domain-containing protein n=1 Tax=Somion occarium TaxID=3059160 RepID=A0ABP1D4G4_9APHY